MNFKRISIVLQVLVVFSCLLPFYPTSCNQKPAKDKLADSIAVLDTFAVKSNQDTILKSLDTASLFSDNMQRDTVKEIKLTDELAEKSKIYKMILRPNNNYSMLGFIIDNLDSLFYGLAAFVLIQLILVIIFKAFGLSLLPVIINISCLLILLFYNPMFLLGKKLWGSYVMMSLLLITIILDIYIWRKSKQVLH